MKAEDICTAASLEFMVVDKETQEKFYFSLCEPLGTIHFTSVHNMSDFYSPCGFTGYTTSKLGTGDSEGERVFGGHLVQMEYSHDTYLIVWSQHTLEWFVINLKDRYDPSPMSLVELGQTGNFKIIGHIHIKPWPEEVRRLLE